MRIFLFLIAIFLIFGVSAQIVDDSTKQVYGPKTTKFTFESNLLNNLESYQNVDTSTYLFDRQSFYDRSGRKFQDLGSFGTATFPIFYTPQQSIGSTSGFNVYSRYAIDPLTVKYYDTKSPFTNLFVYLGGANRNMINIDFSRNVNENWNVGFEFKTITTTKQLARKSQTDRQVLGTSFSGYTHYKHPKIPYQFLVNYSRTNHKVVELGGVKVPKNPPRSSFFLFDNALLLLDDAKGIVKDSRWHVYHDYQVTEQFQLYHVFDYHKEINFYEDFVSANSSGDYDSYKDFYSDFIIHKDTTNERNALKSISNEAGLKGNVSSVFYRFYARLRSVDWKYLLLEPRDQESEKYLGGHVRFNWKEDFVIAADAEYLIGGQYKIGGSLSSDLINVTYYSSKFKVPFIYSDYFGNHHKWNNNFSSIFSNKLEGQITLKVKTFELKPKASLTTYNNFLYFDERINPVQASDGILISSLGGDFNFRFFNTKKEGWHLENELIVTNVSGGSAASVRVPDLFYNGRFFWQGNWFKDLIPVEFGIDIHARSAYYANAYAPEIQQFYLQNQQKVLGSVATDLFMNMRVDKFFFAIKWVYLNQQRNDGYLVTPNYPGQQRVIDLMVRWLFFD